MARKPRIHYPGATYHVILRGNANQDVFFSSADYSRLSFLLQEGVERFHHRIHAFCFMTNHVHLIIQVADIPLSKIVQNFSFRYTRYINKKEKRTGHLFQGRYKAILVDADAYLLQLVRYIHYNPVRAMMVDDCLKYPWSSHRAYMGYVFIPWLFTDWILGQFSEDRERARELFAEFMDEKREMTFRPEFSVGVQGRLLGDEYFIERALKRTEERLQAGYGLGDVVAVVCRVYGIDEEELKLPLKRHDLAEARAMAALVVLESGHLKLMDLAGYLNRDISGLSQGARRLGEKMIGDEVLRNSLQAVREALGKVKTQDVKPDPDAGA